jgi:hypothetical protein
MSHGDGLAAFSVTVSRLVSLIVNPFRLTTDFLESNAPRTLEKLALVRLHPAYADNWRAVAEREVAVRV